MGSCTPIPTRATCSSIQRGAWCCWISAWWCGSSPNCGRDDGLQDVDGVVNGFYALGILDPDVDRGTVQDAARQLMSLAQREDQTPRSMQKVVEEVLQTFYEFPLTLPSDLVYFGRAAVLVEGVALRYDPNYN